MTWLTLEDLLDLHARAIRESAGMPGVRDEGGLRSALAQPQTAVFGVERFPTLVDKAAVLGWTIIRNHPFVDGNKRVGHAALEALLMLNGHEVRAGVDDQERVILAVAAGTMSRDEFTAWLRAHVVPLPSAP